jgi:adenylate cyclase
LIDAGDLLAGFIGSSQRLEYTVIGDSVNTSSRICSMSAKNSVLISEYTYNYVKDRIEAIPVGSRQFKGKQKEVMVYEVMSMTPPSKDAASPQATPTSPETEQQTPSSQGESKPEASSEIPNQKNSEQLVVESLDA